MMESIKELLDRISTPGDMATVLLAGTAGFVVDAGLNFVGFLSPGAVGIASASAALGMKKSAQVSLGLRKMRRKRPVVTRVHALSDYMSERMSGGAPGSPSGWPALREHLLSDFYLFRSGLIDEEQLARTVDSVLDEIRRLQRAPSAVTPAIDG